MRDTIVIDLDGTLSDPAARRHLVLGKKRDYKAFHARIAEDPINEWCKKIMDWAYATGYEIAIVSARPAKLENVTRAWLEKHGVRFTSIYLLRPEDDSTPAVELKRAWLKRYGAPSILFAVDDDSRLVKMWREEGVVCLQCEDKMEGN